MIPNKKTIAYSGVSKTDHLALNLVQIVIRERVFILFLSLVLVIITGAGGQFGMGHKYTL